MSDTSILIIGGGPCGCAAAREAARRGHRVVLAEARPVLGGMAARNVIGDNVYEYGTHVFHTHFPELLSDVRGLIGPELLEIKRGSNLQIKFQGRYFVYPLQGLDLVRNLPPMLGIEAGLSFLKSALLHDVLRLGGPARSTEDYLIRTFGRVLYDVFFKDYSEKVWGVPMSEIDPVFGQQRIPRSDILSVVKQALDALGLSRLMKPHELSESVIGNIFYTERGVGRIYERMGEEVSAGGGTVLTDATLTRLVVDEGRARAAVFATPEGEVEVEADRFVSTIPLPVLTGCLGPGGPADVVRAGAELTYRSLSVVGMLVDKPQVRPPFMTYFKDHSFNRLSEPTNHGLKTTPQGRSMLLAETICGHGDQAWQGGPEFQDSVVRDLEREELLSRKQIIEQHHFAWRYAYPIYTIGFQCHVSRILDYLRELGNVHTTGRQGNFNYVNMHIAMKMGIDTVAGLER